MRSIPSEIITELESEEFRAFYLLEINISGTYYRYTNCDVAIMVEGNRYSPRGFDVDSVRYSMGTVVDRLSLVLDNVDDILTHALVGGSPRGAEVKCLLVLLDEDYNVIPKAAVSVDPTSLWETDDGTGGLKPIIGSYPLLGLWEEDTLTGGLMPTDGESDPFWEDDEETGGMMPI